MPNSEMDGKECIRSFLSGIGNDHRGRSHATILSLSDDDLEYTHDFIQWLFPLEVASLYHPEAPALSPDEFHELGRDAFVIAGVRLAFFRMLKFYGLQWEGDHITKSSDWLERSEEWAWRPNHNDLRISRILHCLSLFDLHTEAAAFLQALEAIMVERAQNPRRLVSFDYWRRAIINVSGGQFDV